MFAFALLAAEAPRVRQTEVSIAREKILIDGRPTCAGRTQEDASIEGRLMNARMVQGVFDDLNPATRPRWTFPDGAP